MGRQQFELLRHGAKLVWTPTRQVGQLRILDADLRLIVWEDGDTTVLRRFNGRIVSSDGETVWGSWYQDLDTQAEWDAAR